MADIDITTIAKTLARVQLNYNNMALSWYNIFYNPEEMMVPVSWYDADGNIVEVEIPNRAMDQKFIKNGEGSPEGNVIANIGSIYQDTLNGQLYIKVLSSGLAEGWSRFMSSAEMEDLIMQGTGEPEGVVTAPVGTLYVRKDLVERGPEEKVGGYLYMKRTSTGNTGWERIDSYPSALIKETFVFKRNPDDINFVDIYYNDTLIERKVENTHIKLVGFCESKEVLNVFVDGVCLSPEMFNLLDDNKTIEIPSGVDIPSTEMSVVVSAQYFSDIHLCDSAIYNDIVELDRDSRKYLYGDVEDSTLRDEEGELLPWDKLPAEYKKSIYSYWLSVKDLSVDITQKVEFIERVEQEAEERLGNYEKELEAGLDSYLEEAKARWESIYNEVKKDYVDIVNMRTLIKKDREVVQNYYDKTYSLYLKIEEDKDFIEKEYEKGNIVTKSEDYTKLVGAPWYDYLQEQINNNDKDIELKVSKLEETLRYDLEKGDAENKQYIMEVASDLRGSITLNSQNIAENRRNLNTLTDRFNTADLADFSNERGGYYNAENFPISKNGIFQKVSTGYSSEEGLVSVTLTKDEPYYKVSLKEAMERAGSNELTFEFSPSEEITSLKEQLGNSVVIVVKVLFRNNSLEEPTMTWNHSIRWLDGEIRFEANKDYLVEFISYDFMETWYAKGSANQIMVNTEETLANDEIVEEDPIIEEPDFPEEPSDTDTDNDVDTDDDTDTDTDIDTDEPVEEEPSDDDIIDEEEPTE